MYGKEVKEALSLLRSIDKTLRFAADVARATAKMEDIDLDKEVEEFRKAQSNGEEEGRSNTV